MLSASRIRTGNWNLSGKSVKLRRMLPIVERELRVAARDPRLHSRRLRWGVVHAATACLLLLFSAGGLRAGAAESFFNFLARIALIFCLLDPVRKAADSISMEKREGTLGFLFLSTLSGADVVLGKFTGALIRSLGVVLPFLPILALSLLVGGTSLGEFWRVAFALVCTLLAGSALCLLVSAFASESSTGPALVVVALLCCLPLIAAIPVLPIGHEASLLSPLRVLSAAGDLAYRTAPGNYWIGLLLLAGLAVLALTIASIAVPHLWQDRPEVRRRAKSHVRESAKRLELLERSPVLWLYFNKRGHTRLLAVSLFLLLAGLLPLFALWADLGDRTVWAVFPGVAGGALFLLICLRVVVQCSTDLHDAKRDGSLELLLSTPLSIEEVFRGFWLALWRTLRVPVLCFFILMISAYVVGAPNSLGQAVWSSKIGIEALLEIPLLATVGMWMGLKCKTRGAALVYSILLGGFLPWMVCIFTIAVQILLLVRGLDQIKRHLRLVRNGGTAVEFPRFVTPPISLQHPTPPVIR